MLNQKLISIFHILHRLPFELETVSEFMLVCSGPEKAYYLGKMFPGINVAVPCALTHSRKRKLSQGDSHTQVLLAL